MFSVSGLYDVWRNLHIWQFAPQLKLFGNYVGVGLGWCCMILYFYARADKLRILTHVQKGILPIHDRP